MWGTHFRSNSDVGYGLYLRLRAKGPGLKPDSCVGLFRGLKAAATPGRDAEASRFALRAVWGRSALVLACELMGEADEEREEAGSLGYASE